MVQGRVQADDLRKLQGSHKSTSGQTVLLNSEKFVELTKSDEGFIHGQIRIGLHKCECQQLLQPQLSSSNATIVCGSYKTSL